MLPGCIFNLDEELAAQFTRTRQLGRFLARLADEHVSPDLLHNADHSQLLFGAAVDFERDDDGKVARDECGVSDGDADVAKGNFLGKGVAVQHSGLDDGDFGLGRGGGGRRRVLDAGSGKLVLESAKGTTLLLGLPLDALLLVAAAAAGALGIRLVAVPDVNFDTTTSSQQDICVRLGGAITGKLVAGQIGVVARADEVAGQRP